MNEWSWLSEWFLNILDTLIIYNKLNWILSIWWWRNEKTTIDKINFEWIHLWACNQTIFSLFVKLKVRYEWRRWLRAIGRSAKRTFFSSIREMNETINLILEFIINSIIQYCTLVNIRSSSINNKNQNKHLSVCVCDHLMDYRHTK